MSTPKEIFLELIKPDGQPERQLCQYEALHMCLTDPINTYLPVSYTHLTLPTN